LSLCFLSYRYADDFWKINLINEKGYLGVSKWMYYHWDGRGISPIYFFRNIILYNFNPIIVSLFSSIGLFFMSFLVLRNIFNLKNAKTENLIFLTIIAVFSFGLWMSWRPHLSRSFYWSTGVYYFWSNFVMILTIIYSKLYYYKFYLFLISFWVSMLSGVNSAVGLLAFIFFVDFIFHKPTFQSVVIYLSGCALFFVNVLAPGNFERGKGLFEFSTNNILAGYLFVFEEYFFMSSGVFIFSFIVAMILFKKISINNSFLIESFVFILCGLLTILPFSFFPDSASKHTAIFFQTFWFLGLVFLFSFILSKLRIPAVNFHCLTIGVLLFLIFIVAKQFYYGKIVSRQVFDRYNYLESIKNTNDTIYLKKIHLPNQSFCFRIYEISSDSNFPQNLLFSDYFNVGPVILKND
jgi:hypothetical protein